MEKLTKKLKDNIEGVKSVLSAKDILVYEFLTGDGTECAIVYTDGMVDKALLGDLAARPLSKLTPENKEKGFTLEEVKQTLLFPELKEETQLQNIFAEVLDGNSLLLVDGLETGLIVGAKLLPARAVMEPPTDIAVKGPREGFIEDIKTNMALLRKRLKTPDLKFELQKAGKRSQTNIAICYLDGICDEKVKKEVAARIGEIDIDCIPDSSYVAAFIAPRKHSIFREVGTTEKPDILAAKMAEGRVGILVDGSPIALTVPFILTEDFQSSEDYFVSPFMATIFRAIRFLAILIALLLPAFYVTSQLFKMQLIPLGLMLNIASSVQGLPLSPSLEMFLVLLTLEVLKEASIRMPKYVGMALSIVGALVLGEAAVFARLYSGRQQWPRVKPMQYRHALRCNRGDQRGAEQYLRAANRCMEGCANLTPREVMFLLDLTAQNPAALDNATNVFGVLKEMGCQPQRIMDVMRDKGPTITVEAATEFIF